MSHLDGHHGHPVQPNSIWISDECRVQDMPEQDEVIGVVNESAFQLVSGEKGQTTTFLTFVVQVTSKSHQ